MPKLSHKLNYSKTLPLQQPFCEIDEGGGILKLQKSSSRIHLFHWHAVLVVDRLDFVHPPAVLFFHQRIRVQPGLDDFAGHHVPDNLGT